MNIMPPPRLGTHRVLQGPQMARPDVRRESTEVRQRLRLVEQEFREATMSLAQIAGGAGGHYVAARAVAAAHLGLHMINRQCSGLELQAAVHTAPVIPDEEIFAFHDGRIS
jgi:hypothetical protein